MANLVDGSVPIESKEILNSRQSPVVKTKQSSAVINGFHTEVLCSNFSDRLLVVITQYGKLGTLIHITRHTVLEPDKPPMCSCNVLMGKDEPLYHVYAQQLVKRMGNDAGSVKPVILAVALKDETAPVMRKVLDMVQENKVW